MRIWIKQRGKGETAWAVMVDEKMWASGLTKREAGGLQHTLELQASPEARAAARERLTGAGD
ncbi:hypothetical protein [Nocardioides aestuarii]|uniref:Uncharacterized protein n=1 Tax=Nocardioides aestuarii TaxID=252231 RepID=A0ABW4TFR6_9ACTN